MTERQLIPLGNRGLQMTTFDELFRFSQFVIDAGFAPYGFDSPQKVFLALQMGLEAGLPPMAAIQNIAVVNGRPSFYGSICQALVAASGNLEDEKEEWTGTEGNDDFTCTVKLKRFGQPTWREGKWSLKDTRIAGLARQTPKGASPHITYPRIMMYWRAWHIAANKAFADVLKGVRPHELNEEEARIGFDGAKPTEGRVLPPVLPTKESLTSPRQDKPKDKEAPVDDTKAETKEPESTVPPAPQQGLPNPPDAGVRSEEPDPVAEPAGDDPEEIGYWFWIRKHLVELDMTEAQFMFFLRKQGIASSKSKNLDQVPEEIIKGVVQRWDNIRRKIAEDADNQLPM